MKKPIKFASINLCFIAIYKPLAFILFEFKGDKLYLETGAKNGGKYDGKETDF
jgi:hypothetical protein